MCAGVAEFWKTLWKDTLANLKVHAPDLMRSGTGKANDWFKSLTVNVGEQTREYQTTMAISPSSKSYILPCIVG